MARLLTNASSANSSLPCVVLATAYSYSNQRSYGSVSNKANQQGIVSRKMIIEGVITGDQSLQHIRSGPQDGVEANESALNHGVETTALDGNDNSARRRRQSCDSDESSDDDTCNQNYVTSSDHDNDDDNTTVTLDDSISSRSSLKPSLSLSASNTGPRSELSGFSRVANAPTPKVTDMYQFYQRLNRYAFSCNTSYTGVVVVTVDMGASVPSSIIGDEMELDQSCRQMISNSIYNRSQVAAIAPATAAATGISSKKTVTLRISFIGGQQNEGHRDNHKEGVSKLLFECVEVSTEVAPVVLEDYNDVRTMAESLGGDIGTKHVVDGDGEARKVNVAWFTIPCLVPTPEESPQTENKEATHVVGDSVPLQSGLDSRLFPSLIPGVRANPFDLAANRVTPNLVRPTTTLPPLPPLPPNFGGIGGVGGGDFSVIFDQFDDGPTTDRVLEGSETTADVTGLTHNPSDAPTLPSWLESHQQEDPDTLGLPPIPSLPTDMVGGVNAALLFERFRDGPTIANTSSGMSIIPPPQFHVHRQPSPLARLHGSLETDYVPSSSSQEDMPEGESQRHHYPLNQATIEDPTTDGVDSDGDEEDDDSDESPSRFIIDEGNFRCLVR